jgi:adenylate kinase family enzyme
MLFQDRRRILVVGSGGAGKTTFARELAERTGLPLVHLDREYWRPGWIEPPKGQWRARVAELIAAETWIMDGNYSGTLELRLTRADAVVFFDVPRWTCVRGVLARWMEHRGRPRPELPPDCPERIDFKFLAWIWSYPEHSRPRIVNALERAGTGVEVVTIGSHADASRLLERA